MGRYLSLTNCHLQDIVEQWLWWYQLSFCDTYLICYMSSCHTGQDSDSIAEDITNFQEKIFFCKSILSYISEALLMMKLCSVIFRFATITILSFTLKSSSWEIKMFSQNWRTTQHLHLFLSWNSSWTRIRTKTQVKQFSISEKCKHCF